MDNKNYGFMEDYILEKYPDAIKTVKKDFDGIHEEYAAGDKSNNYSSNFDNVFLNIREDKTMDDLEGASSGRQSSLARVRTNDGISSAKVEPIPNEELNYPDGFSFGTGSGYGNNSGIKGSSFVLVVAAVITLVLLVTIVTFGIIRIVNF